MSNTRTYEELKQKLDAMADEMLGRKAEPDTAAKKQIAAYNSAFWDTMHTGMPNNELKVGSDGAGGYLVPDTYDNHLVMALEEENVLRKLGTTFQTTHKLYIPVSEGIDGAVWVKEGESYSFGEAKFREVVIDAHKLGTSVLASDEMLEDGGVDLEAYIETMFAERIGSAEEDAFVHGDGKNKPLGIIYQAEVGAETEKDGVISMDDMINLQHSVPRVYRGNAVWVMSEDAYYNLRRIVQHNGKPLWNNNLQEGEPQKLFGHEIYVCKSMDKVLPGKIPVMFGDFSYFWIGERGKRVMKRLVERYADRGQVAFIMSERIDAKLVLPEAVKLLKVSGTPVETIED